MDSVGLSRRALLGALGGAGLTTLAGCSGPSDVGPDTEAPPTVTDHPDYSDHVGDAPAYDRTDRDEVVVYNGVQGNGGYYAFEPVAVVVTPGTTIIWRWTGQGGLHNVVAVDRAVQSDLTGEEGHEFTHTVTEPGLLRYYCEPHESRGMRGVIVIQDE